MRRGCKVREQQASLLLCHILNNLSRASALKTIDKPIKRKITGRLEVNLLTCIKTHN